MYGEFQKTASRQPIKPNSPTGGGQAVATGSDEPHRKPVYTIISRVYDAAAKVFSPKAPSLTETQRIAHEAVIAMGTRIADEYRDTDPTLAGVGTRYVDESMKKLAEDRPENHYG
jgi:hypothetical protein